MNTTSIINRPDLARAAELFADCCTQSREWDKAAKKALEAYGNHGSQISGCVRDHFPESTKSYLRSLARNVSILSDAAWAARPARVRHMTMLKLARAIVKRDGGGFYGPRV
jgi:hypothetical protein